MGDDVRLEKGVRHQKCKAPEGPLAAFGVWAFGVCLLFQVDFRQGRCGQAARLVRLLQRGRPGIRQRADVQRFGVPTMLFRPQ